MRDIFVGMVMVFLDFTLDLNAVRIGLIPDFIGYYFMLKGLTELTVFSGRFSSVKPYVNGMLVYSLVLYLLDLFAASSIVNSFLGMVLGAVSTALSLYISYTIIMGIKDIEAMREQDLNTAQLYSVWRLMAISLGCIYLLLYIPYLNAICIILSVAAAIYYLYIFNKTKRLFYERTEA